MADPFVTVSWLKDALARGDSSVRVIDISFPMPGEKIDMAEEFKKKHIAGATYFPLSEVRNKDTKFALMLPSPEVFADHVSKVHGVSNNTHVVVYDRNTKFGLFSACRLWWMFRVFGHANVSVLDGGFGKWCCEDGATADGESPAVEVGSFVATYQAQYVMQFTDVSTGLASKSVQVCDARGGPRFNGEAPEPNPKLPSGHMVGATNIPFFKMLQSDTKTFKSADGVREVFASCNVDLAKPTIMSCGSGVTACVLAMAAFVAGLPGMPVFDGSWTEFVQSAESRQMENLQFEFKAE